jgi:hypothetical protein
MVPPIQIDAPIPGGWGDSDRADGGMQIIGSGVFLSFLIG